MTYLEAAEVILSGQTHEACPDCCNGYLLDHSDGEDFHEYKNSICKSCCGAGVVVSQTYLDAMHIIDMVEEARRNGFVVPEEAV